MTGAGWRLAPLGLLFACASGPPPGAADDSASGLYLLGADTVKTACERDCEARAQARAVSPQVIATDCKRSCKAVEAWPVVAGGPAARQQIGRRVRAFGTIEGQALLLVDGVRVRLDGVEVPPPGPAWVVGKLETEPEGFVLTVRFVAAARRLSAPAASG